MQLKNLLFCLFILLFQITLNGCSKNIIKASNKSDLKMVASLNTELGFRYMQDGEFELSEKKLLKALEADPKNAEAHNAMGLLRSALGEVDVAERSFLRAIQLTGDSPAIANNYGQFLCQQGRYDKGINYLISAAEDPLNTSRGAAHFNLGKCYKSSGQIKNAELHFKANLKYPSVNAEALIELAHLKLLQQEFFLAEHYLKKFARVADHTPFSLWVGYSIASENRDLDSVDSFRLLLKGLFPDSTEFKKISENDLQGHY